MDGTSGWRKGSHSGTGNCVEVLLQPEAVYVRDTKNRSGPVLRFTLAEWDAFIRSAQAGEFNVTDEDEARVA